MRRQALVIALAAGLGSPGAALAHRVWGPDGPEQHDPPVGVLPGDPPRRIIYLNRDGGMFSHAAYGNDEPGLNQAYLVPDTRAIGGWITPDENWNKMVACSRLMWGRFNVEVTDVDPGDVPHIEAVFARDPEQIGQDPGTGGVSPATCGVFEKSVVFIFANAFSGNAQRICEVAAQEIAHSYGLDHELLCEDPMTYLGGCGNKSFQNYDAQCGEGEVRPCSCSRPFQNSVALMIERLGAAETEPPTVAIDAPAAGDVPPGFAVNVTAQDNYIVTKVDLWVDGVQSASLSNPPYEFKAPSTLTAGAHTIEVRAYDPGSNVGTASVTVNVVGECTVDADCGDDRVCAGIICLGGVGAGCSRPDDCASGSCAMYEGEFMCTETCTPGAAGACPDGFECSTAGGGIVDKCWPAEGGGGGCLAVAGGTGHGGAAATGLLALALAALLGRRRG